MIWKRLDDLLNLAGKISCVLVFLICAYAVYDGYMVYKAAGSSAVAYKPDKDGKMPEAGELAGVVAWITIEDTSVDYPVMQGIDNAEYINKDPYGNYSVSGSVFLDCRNRSDFSDSYNLVYGHHMEHDYMFGVLDHFLNQEYLESHRNGTLYTRDQVYDIDFFASMEASADEDSVFAPTESDYPLRYICAHASALIDNAPGGSRIIGLSTCRFPETLDRTILFGYLRKRSGDMENAETE